MDDEYPWHRLAFRYSVQSETGYGAPIVSEQDPSLFGCPLKNRPIVGLPQPYVLDADQVDGRQSPNQPAHDVIIEILVTQQPEQCARPWRVA